MPSGLTFPSVTALAACFLAAASLGCVGETASEPAATFPDEPLTTVTSNDGAFVLEVRTSPKQPPSRGQVQVELSIADANGEPRDDLSLHVVPWMADMAHGTQNDPNVTAEGSGRYEVGPVDMFMSGQWELRTTIKGVAEDSANIVFEIP